MPKASLAKSLTTEEREEFVGNQQLLINPTWQQVKKALTKAEYRTWINQLPPDLVRKTFKKVTSGQEELVTLGIVECPKKFIYNLNSTVFQAVRLYDDVVGVYIARQSAAPGTATEPPIHSFERQPTRWFDTVMNTFWTALTDEQMNRIRERMILRLFPNSFAELEILFGVNRPEFISEAALNIRTLAKRMHDQNVDQMTWGQLKKFDPVTTARYQNTLLALAENNVISRQALEDYCDASKIFTLAYGQWSGLQRIFAEAQLVLVIRSPALIEPTLNALPNQVTEKMISACRYHPSDMNTVGWIRLHIDHTNKIVFIDEVQSDFIEIAREHRETVQPLLNAAEPWARHGICTCLQWARQIGYRLGFHTRASAAQGEGRTPSARKWNTYYGQHIKRFKFTETVVDGYPGPINVLE